MKLADILKSTAVCGEIPDTDCTNIEYDSRKARFGDLFVCLVGAKRDGHDFAMRAYDNGCRAFLCQRRLDLPADAVQVICADTRSALASCAAEFYMHSADRLHIIGITGTKGKTTTALLTAAILNASGMNCAYIGSNGVIINGKHTETVNTTPESLELHHYFSLMVRSGVKYAVLEVSSQALGHHRTDGIPFEVTAFTNLSEDHIGEGEHPDFEDYRRCKKRLFTDYGCKYMIYNADDPAAKYMTDGCDAEKISYSLDPAADAVFTASSVEEYRTRTSLGVNFVCSIKNRMSKVPVSLMSPGKFSAYNGLCAIAIASCFGIEPDFAASVLRRTPVQGRFEIVEGLADRTFIIDYSHNGLSLTKALETLREYSPERLICLFGSVGGRTQCRRRELAEAAGKYADYSIITSDNPDFEAPEDIIKDIAAAMPEGAHFECIVNREDAIKRAVEMSRPGDIVLFAGKGHETYQLICGKKVPFSERGIILDFCEELSAVR